MDSLFPSSTSVFTTTNLFRVVIIVVALVALVLAVLAFIDARHVKDNMATDILTAASVDGAKIAAYIQPHITNLQNVEVGSLRVVDNLTANSTTSDSIAVSGKSSLSGDVLLGGTTATVTVNAPSTFHDEVTCLAQIQGTGGIKFPNANASFYAVNDSTIGTTPPSLKLPS